MRNKRGYAFLSGMIVVFVISMLFILLSSQNNSIIIKQSKKIGNNLIDEINDKNGLERLHADINYNPTISGEIKYEDIEKTYEIEEIDRRIINRKIDNLSNYYIENILQEDMKILYLGDELLNETDFKSSLNRKEISLNGFKYFGDFNYIRSDILPDKERFIVSNKRNFKNVDDFIIEYKDISSRRIKVVEKGPGKDIEYIIDIFIKINNNKTVKEIKIVD